MVAPGLAAVLAQQDAGGGIEEADMLLVPLDGDLTSEPAWRRRGVGAGDLDAAVEMHRAGAELIVAEGFHGQGQQCGPFLGEHAATWRVVVPWHRFRQMRRGRPGPNTSYRKTTRRHPDLEWRLDEAALAYDRRSDGMYPLLTNDKTLTPAQVLDAHKAQPTLEKRFQPTKTVHEIAPVFLKNAGRIEALFTLYFLGLLVQALIERELRAAIRRARIAELPLYPEERRSNARRRSRCSDSSVMPSGTSSSATASPSRSFTPTSPTYRNRS